MAKGKKHTPEQIVSLLRQIEVAVANGKRDAKIHVEFRTLGGPTNRGVYIQDRYEANINEPMAVSPRTLTGSSITPYPPSPASAPRVRYWSGKRSTLTSKRRALELRVQRRRMVS